MLVIVIDRTKGDDGAQTEYASVREMSQANTGRMRTILTGWLSTLRSFGISRVRMEHARLSFKIESDAVN